MNKLFEMTVSTNDGDMLIRLLIPIAVLCLLISNTAIRPVIKQAAEDGNTRVGVFLWTSLIAMMILLAIYLLVTFSVTFK